MLRAELSSLINMKIVLRRRKFNIAEYRRGPGQFSLHPKVTEKWYLSGLMLIYQLLSTDFVCPVLIFGLFDASVT
jgi:hypothetical protein